MKCSVLSSAKVCGLCKFDCWESNWCVKNSTGDGIVINVLLGSDNFEHLQYKKLIPSNMQLVVGNTYEVKVVGPWGENIHVLLKGRLYYINILYLYFSYYSQFQ
jgi:hypothetical protein